MFIKFKISVKPQELPDVRSPIQDDNYLIHKLLAVAEAKGSYNLHPSQGESATSGMPKDTAHLSNYGISAASCGELVCQSGARDSEDGNGEWEDNYGISDRN
jgi:hypothetical protein